MVKTLIISDGHPYTHQFVEQLIQQQHSVYVYTPPTTKQLTKGISLEIDLYDLTQVQHALEDIDWVTIIGNPTASFTALTQGSQLNKERLIYHNLAQAMHTHHINHCLVIHDTLKPSLKQAMAYFNVETHYQTLLRRYRLLGKRALQQGYKEVKTVRSIQSLEVPNEVPMDGVVSMYGLFLKTINGHVINGVYDGTTFNIIVPFINLPLLKMTRTQESDRTNRVVFDITGGLLVGHSFHQPQMEFRRLESTSKTCLIALHNYVPRLPWHIYRYTQAPIHVLVSWLFHKYWRQIKY